ncbi:SDR family NAD(P)-dependent oxidoreductase [Alkalicoccus luteus]|uniref:SDR family oxidoreductase n=1 Tax=Alkalicoccus luteus TaxID=1237094 RepID=A0A969PPT0_9BACI|nr:SDR family oxidoreductase [Alkalicoccus luteus]NJP38142.1 SDR family oxidoreductase [Alkalicoccus luteus]
MSMFHANAFKGTHVLITGATGGIGKVLALELLKLGAQVTAAGRNEEKLRSLSQQAHYHADASNLLTIQADLTDTRDRERLVFEAEEAFGPLTGLVNGAGIAGGDVVESIKEDELESIMQINFTSAVMLSQLVFKSMKERGKGSVVNISSLSGLRGTHGSTAYAGSKFAMIGFTHSFALEAIEHGVRVNAVCPGFVDTDMARQILEKKAVANGISYEEQREQTEKALPSGRITTPEETARTIMFLLSDAADNIVGESLKISGGSVMR